MKIGEIYFIRERDRIDGGSSSYVKIGMVNDLKRNSEERLSDHQTGNPRDLVLHHVTQTPGPFRIERFLHQRFGPNRVRSEWFRLSDEELAVAVQTAEQMAEEALLHIPIMEEASRLKDVVSSTDKIAPTEESTHWIYLLSVAKEALKLCQAMSNSYKAVAHELPKDVRAEVEQEELVVTEHYLDKSFDMNAFCSKYPGLIEEFEIRSTSIIGRFTPKLSSVDLAEVDRDLVDFCSNFQDSCERVGRGELTFGDLFDMHQILEQFTGSYSWNSDVADAHLRVLCGSSAGIEGQVTWNRVPKDETTIDSERLESEHPEKYNEFITVKTLSRVRTRRRARRKL